MPSFLESLNIPNSLLLGSLSMIITSAAASEKPARAWSVVETAKDNGHRLSAMPAPTKAAASAENTIVCDPSKTFQEIVGFGGALTESSAWVLAQLPQEQRMEILRRYYDPKEGIGYTLARTHINSCDFSLSMWSLTPTPGDYDLHDFTLDPMRRWLMPLIHDTRNVAGGDRFKLMASPWSPPAWMKTNNRMDDGGSLRNEYRPAWANVYVSDDYASSARVHEKYPDKHILFTEGCVEGAPGNMGKWENGERYARNIIGDFSNHVCGFIDWNIVLDQRGGPNHVGNFCDAPVIVDTNTKKVTYGPSFYYLAHFSKFVQPGARRIHSEGGPKGIQSIAFNNPDGTLAIVVVNPTKQAAGFALDVAGETLACKIPARAIQTHFEASH
jgi:O-glycosyl hydrolase